MFILYHFTEDLDVENLKKYDGVVLVEEGTLKSDELKPDDLKPDIHEIEI